MWSHIQDAIAISNNIGLLVFFYIVAVTRAKLCSIAAVASCRAFFAIVSMNASAGECKENPDFLMFS